MAGRKRQANSVLPLRGKVQADTPPVWKIGRGLLAPSHAGTRLPIAVCGPDPGRSPSVRSRAGRDARSFLRYTSLPQKESKKQRTPMGARRSSPNMNSLRWHYPHQVKGRSDASSQPSGSPVFGTIMTFGEKIVKGVAKRGKTVYNHKQIKQGSPLARAERGPARSRPRT